MVTVQISVIVFRNVDAEAVVSHIADIVVKTNFSVKAQLAGPISAVQDCWSLENSVVAAERVNVDNHKISVEPKILACVTFGTATACLISRWNRPELGANDSGVVVHCIQVALVSNHV